MTYIKATKTLKSIEQTIANDQGASFRTHLKNVLPHIGDAYRGAEDNPFRSHLGASVIGNECGRAVWYGFRWATKPKFGGRLLRLFNRGHLEEGRVIASLLCIGVQIYQQDENGKQFRISDVGGHFGGSGDGVAIGIPDLPDGTPCLLEFKTHNDKSFKKMVAEGVRSSKFEHYVQMNVYMRKMGIPVALYCAVNKNDDDYHMEIVHLDPIIADQFIDRARTIIMMTEAPTKVNNSPGWFACSWCDHKPICHLGALPEKTCRSCTYADAALDGAWQCRKISNGNPVLTTEQQLKACDHYSSML